MVDLVASVNGRLDEIDLFDYFIHVDPELLTTHDAARLLGVGTTSVKRWADAGLLPCVKTPGGHRRYPRSAVEALLGVHANGGAERGIPDTGGADPGVPPTAEWVHAWVVRLTKGRGADEIITALLAERDARGKWSAVADRLSHVLTEIGRRWANGHLSVLQEHLASERFARGIARALATIELGDDAPRALLLVTPGDDHTLGLSLAELCLREAGWSTEWAGRRTPIDTVSRFVEAEPMALIAVSASEVSNDGPALLALANHLGTICRARHVQLLLGGTGAWPDSPSYGRRVRTFAEIPSAR